MPPGSFVGLLGPNGSGKSTLFKVLCTLLAPTSGTARVLGHDVTQDAAAVRRQLGVVFQHPALDKELTARENLLCHGRLLGMSKADAALRADTLLDAVEASDEAGSFVKTLSGGMRRRIEMAKALINRPPVLLLDEPTVGLDPGARRRVWAMLDRARQSSDVPLTIVLTTHLMDEASACESLVLLNEGKVVAEGSPRELVAAAAGEVVSLVPESMADSHALASSLTDAQVVGDQVRVEQNDGAELVRRAMAGELAVAVREASVGRPTLEDAFIRLTGRGLGEEH